jgi:hypothetical protein
MPQYAMRGAVDKDKLAVFMSRLGRAATSPGRVYLAGGSTALLLDIRMQTIDIDIKLDPEPLGVFEAIAKLKEELAINVELASPDDFLPAVPGWQERSEFITRSGPVEFFHYDFYGQALSKILRGHTTDLADAKALVDLGKVEISLLQSYLAEIKPLLIRYPSINIEAYEQRLKRFVDAEDSHQP